MALYLSQPFLLQLSTNVLKFAAVDPSECKTNKVPSDVIELVTHKIVLKTTIFHPQGGGQPSDRGKINADNGEIFQVLFVKVSDIGIEHYGYIITPENVSPTVLKEEDLQVEIYVDETLRKLNSRSHSAGHTIDAALKRCDNDIFSRIKATKGYHFNDSPYVEYIGNMTEKEMSELPENLNAILKDIISENIPTVITNIEKSDAMDILNMTAEDLSHYPETIRAVEVAGFNMACGGTHVASTADLIGITITKIKKKKNVIKVSYVIA